jgi:hypothetical protein
MSPQRFRVEEADLPGERVSGIMDERPELDSGRRSRSVMRDESYGALCQDSTQLSDTISTSTQPGRTGISIPMTIPPTLTYRGISVEKHFHERSAELQIPRLRSPGFPVELGGVDGPHAPFLKRKAHTRSLIAVFSNRLRRTQPREI